MATLTINTHAFVKELTATGISEAQAEAIADAISRVRLEDVATKNDLLQLKIDLIKWIVPLLLGQLAGFALLVQWMIK